MKIKNTKTEPTIQKGSFNIPGCHCMEWIKDREGKSKTVCMEEVTKTIHFALYKSNSFYGDIYSWLFNEHKCSIHGHIVRRED